MYSLSRPADPPSRQAGPFSVEYTDASERARVLADKNVFAVIGFADEHRFTDPDPRVFSIALPEVGTAGGTLEVWRSQQPVISRLVDGITIAQNEDMLFARLLLDEAGYDDLDAATFDAYRRIRHLVQQMDYPYLLRTWNYFPDINGLQQGEERYRAFSQGRFRALANNDSLTFETTLPAACAIGTHTPGLLIYFLAAKTPGEQIENPRQVSAFRYPPQYGPRSPSFSRAILKRWGGESHLYISGTASIVGHASQHPSHPLQQLDETLVNLETLLEHANRYLKEALRLALIKVYIRPGLPIAAIQQHLQDRLGSGFPKRLLLTGDICRDDLLLEIEGLGIGP